MDCSDYILCVGSGINLAKYRTEIIDRGIIDMGRNIMLMKLLNSETE